MDSPPDCPKCNSSYTYKDRDFLVCPECTYEWSPNNTELENNSLDIVKDANGNILNDGDTVVLIKELKIKGSNSAIKIGTKVKNIKLTDGDHDIDCKIKGFGAMQLKSQFVKKSK